MTDEEPAEIDKSLWAEAWCDQRAADGQLELSTRELQSWLAGEPHVSFDAFTELLKKCGEPEDILEIGCGCGYYQAVVKRLFPETIFWGVDASAAMLEIAKREYPTGKFLIVKAEELPFSYEYFSVAVLGSVIGCCDDWQAAIRNAFHVAKEFVIVHRVSAHNDADGVREYVKEGYGVTMADRTFNEAELVEFCSQFGTPWCDPIKWSIGPDKFQVSFLFKVNHADAGTGG